MLYLIGPEQADITNLTLYCIAIAILSLSMSTDAFAAAVGRGASHRPAVKDAVKAGLVFGVIEAEYEKSGEMLGVEAAAEKVEKYLEAEAEKAFKAKKYAARFSPSAKAVAPPTLTNAVTPAPAPARGRMTESERMAAAIAALKD